MKDISPQTLSVYEFYKECGIKAKLRDGFDTITAKVRVLDVEIDLVSHIRPQINGFIMELSMPFKIPATHHNAILELLVRANMQLYFGCYEYDFDEKLLVFRMTNVFTSMQFDTNILSNMLESSIDSVDHIAPMLIRVLNISDDLIEGLSVKFMLENSNFLIDEESSEESQEDLI